MYVIKSDAFLIEVHKVQSATKLVNIFLKILIKVEVAHELYFARVFHSFDNIKDNLTLFGLK